MFRHGNPSEQCEIQDCGGDLITMYGATCPACRTLSHSESIENLKECPACGHIIYTVSDETYARERSDGSARRHTEGQDLTQKR